MQRKMENSEKLEQKKVLVTGASSGIGAGIAKKFACNNAFVYVHFHHNEPGARATLSKVKEAGSDGIVIQADLTDTEGIDHLLRQIGQVDILVNNAGVVPKGPILTTAVETWDTAMALNTRAPYFLSRGIAERMIQAGTGGSILNICSIHAALSVENFSVYAVSKTALEALTRIQALEWAEHGIRVNAISPGVVPVERSREYLEADRDKWLPHIPLQRYGRVQDIADLAVFLAGSASSWTTGQVFTCDGGMSVRADFPRRSPVDFR
jgi:glucose 1-dehydrogenase